MAREKEQAAGLPLSEALSAVAGAWISVGC